MRLYRVDHEDPDQGCIVEWSRSKAAARRIIARIRREHGRDALIHNNGEPRLVKIPTSKSGLVAWLNNHFNTDNG